MLFQITEKPTTGHLVWSLIRWGTQLVGQCGIAAAFAAGAINERTAFALFLPLTIAVLGSMIVSNKYLRGFIMGSFGVTFVLRCLTTSQEVPSESLAINGAALLTVFALVTIMIETVTKKRWLNVMWKLGFALLAPLWPLVADGRDLWRTRTAPPQKPSLEPEKN